MCEGGGGGTCVFVTDCVCVLMSVLALCGCFMECKFPLVQALYIINSHCVVPEMALIYGT